MSQAAWSPFLLNPASCASFRHPLLRLMPLRDDAPADYLWLQEGVFAALAPDLTPLERAGGLTHLWCQYERHVASVPEPLALIAEVAELVCVVAYTFQAAEVRLHAALNVHEVFVQENGSPEHPLGLPMLTAGKHGPILPEGRHPRCIDLLNRAMVRLGGLGKPELTALPPDERRSAIRLLSLFLLHGRTDRSDNGPETRECFFDRLGLPLWRELAKGLEADDAPHLYGEPAIARMEHAVRSATTTRGRAGQGGDDQIVEPAVAGPDAVELHTSQGPLHLVVRDRFPASRDADERAHLKLYEPLRRPMPLAPLPAVDLLDKKRAELEREFGWACDAIDGVFAELRARRLLGSMALGFRPVLLKGPAGSGKTRLAKRLGEVLGIRTFTFNAAGSSDAMNITGTNRGWSTGQPSPLLRPLLDGCATVLMVLDEVDKAADLSRNSPPLQSALLPLLERREARRWRDNFLQVECDLSCLQWVLTCNDVTWLSSALRSRLTIHEVRRPTSIELLGVVEFAVRDLEIEWHLPAGALAGAPISDMLPARMGSLRDLQKCVALAASQWVHTVARQVAH